MAGRSPRRDFTRRLGNTGGTKKRRNALHPHAHERKQPMSESHLPKSLGLSFGLLFLFLMALNSYAFH
jgi:hypothetical protein